MTRVGLVGPLLIAGCLGGGPAGAGTVDGSASGIAADGAARERGGSLLRPGAVDPEGETPRPTAGPHPPAGADALDAGPGSPPPAPLEDAAAPLPGASQELAVFTDVTATAGVAYRQAPPHDLTGNDWYHRTGLTGEAAFMSGGAAAGDFDGDGWLDLFVTRLHDHGLLFRNRGDGSFEDVTAAQGLDAVTVPTVGAAFGDLDNDGDLDLYVTTLAAPRFLLFVNGGDGFTEQGQTRGASANVGTKPRQGFGVSLGDYDRDGWLDIHTSEWQWNLSPTPSASHSRLLRNRGAQGTALAGHFEDVTRAAGVELSEGEPPGDLSFASTFSDLDDDGWPELLVAADFGESRLFWNQGDGTFHDGTAAAGVGLDENGMGHTVGDYDGDGDLDWFVTAIHCAAGNAFGDCPLAGNRLYRNEGARTFSEVAAPGGVADGDWGWGTSFFDQDNDGDLDLAMTNGIRFAGSAFASFLTDPARLWRNQGAGVWSDRTVASRLIDHGDGKGLLVFDYDNDGDQDLFVVNHVAGGRLFRNDGGNHNGWLRVELQGRTANRQGIGARVSVQVREDGPRLVRELRAGSNFLGQNEPLLHFGLGPGDGASDSPVAEVRVLWPTPGARKQQLLRNVARNQTLRLMEPE